MRADLQVTATGNLLYNLAALARDSGSGVLTLRLDCAYEGLRFVPLSPGAGIRHCAGMEERSRRFPLPQRPLLEYSKKYISGMIQDLI